MLTGDRATRRIRRLSTSGVVALAVAGFTLSYGALHQLAVTHGVPPGLAWVWPLIIDGFIVVASLAVLHAVLERRRTAYPWALVLLFSTVSVAFNVMHAPPTPVARLVAAVPPLALVLSFELLMRQIRTALESPPQSSNPSAPTSARTERSVATPTPLRPLAVAAETPRPRRRTVTSQTSTGELVPRARRVFDEWTARGERVTGAVLARELGISDGYGRRLLRQFASEADAG
ncbi:MAG TPA: DUF2637 domain-containing protein [Nocardioidaceae bacterium]